MFMEIRYQAPIRLRPNQRELRQDVGTEATVSVRAEEGHAHIMGVWRSGIETYLALTHRANHLLDP